MAPLNLASRLFVISHKIAVATSRGHSGESRSEKAIETRPVHRTIYRDSDPARGSRPASVLDADPCPAFHLDCDLERGAVGRALSRVFVDVALPRRAPSIGGLSGYGLDLADCHRPGNLACIGTDR